MMFHWNNVNTFMWQYESISQLNEHDSYIECDDVWCAFKCGDKLTKKKKTKWFIWNLMEKAAHSYGVTMLYNCCCRWKSEKKEKQAKNSKESLASNEGICLHRKKQMGFVVFPLIFRTCCGRCCCCCFLIIFFLLIYFCVIEIHWINCALRSTELDELERRDLIFWNNQLFRMRGESKHKAFATFALLMHNNDRQKKMSERKNTLKIYRQQKDKKMKQTI